MPPMTPRTSASASASQVRVRTRRRARAVAWPSVVFCCCLQRRFGYFSIIPLDVDYYYRGTARSARSAVNGIRFVCTSARNRMKALCTSSSFFGEVGGGGTRRAPEDGRQSNAPRPTECEPIDGKYTHSLEHTHIYIYESIFICFFVCVWGAHARRCVHSDGRRFLGRAIDDKSGRI